MSQKRNRRQFTGEQKAAIVKPASASDGDSEYRRRPPSLVDQVPVSDLCDEYKILPTRFYQ